MNIAFVIMNAGSGGHTRTAVTIAEALAKRGHQITFVTGSDRNSPVLANTKFDVLGVPTSKIGTYDQLDSWVGKLVKEKAIDVVHTFAYFGLTELASICKRQHIPLWWTICGEAPLRPLDYDFLKFRSTVSLSQEVKDGLVELHGFEPSDVDVIPARIDIQKVLSKVDGGPEQFASFRKKYGISPNSKIIFRVARVHTSYENSFLQSIEASKRLNRKGLDVCFVHIGYVQQEEVYKRLKSAVSEANKESGKTVAVTAQDEALNALSYLGMADMVIGTGRAAFEAMLASKPIIVVGVNGFAGLISAQTVDSIAHYNFAGRNISQRKDWGKSIGEIVTTAEMLLTDTDAYETVCSFGKQYVLKHLDADVAAEKYEKLYYRSIANPILPKQREIMRSAALFRAKSLWRYILSEKSRAYVKTLLGKRKPSLN